MSPRGRSCDIRRNLGDIYHVLTADAAERDNAGISGFLGDLHHLHRVLRSIERKADLLFKPCAGNSDRQLRALQIGAIDRDPRFERRRQNAVFVGDLREFTAHQVQKLADRIRAAQFELVNDAADPFIRFLIFFAVCDHIADPPSRPKPRVPRHSCSDGPGNDFGRGFREYRCKARCRTSRSHRQTDS